MTAVEIARRYIGTPFHHQGRVPSVGLDCVGVLICVARELKLVASDFDVTGYHRQPDGADLMRHLSAHLEPVTQAEMQPGDIVCVAFDKHPQHVGIVGDYRHGGLSIIHAASKHGAVIETRLMFTQAMRFVAAFRFKDA
jgi:cell wall-associated NlpC family hydrolase